MKKLLMLLLAASQVVLLTSHTAARELGKPRERAAVRRPSNERSSITDPQLQSLTETAQAAQYCIVKYDFETMNWQGWVLGRQYGTN